jgi:cytosine/adenosine deaminase-related metal-dependent hydrolase
MLARVWSIPGTMHPAFVAGVIEAGALANVVVWDTNHPAMWPALDPLHTLTMADATKAIHAMYVAGRRIGRDGDFQRSIVDSDGYRAARLEASERLTRLLAQLDQRATS